MSIKLHELTHRPPTTILTYKTIGETTLNLHVYYPDGHDGSAHKPAVVFFFGGGWKGGSPKQFYPQCDHFSRRGIVAVSVEYRTEGEHGVDPVTCVQDSKSAIRWIRTHAEKLGIDPHKLAVGGGSAGGHLAAATAFLDAIDEKDVNCSTDCIPNALILFNPVIDNGPGEYGHDRVKDIWRDFSPRHNIGPQAPPTVIFLGSEDEHISITTAEKFRNEMVMYGVRCNLHIYNGAGHGFFNSGIWYEKTLQEADNFLVSLGYLTCPNKL
jgi:acetyl esterase/lipase